MCGCIALILTIPLAAFAFIIAGPLGAGVVLLFGLLFAIFVAVVTQPAPQPRRRY